MSDGADDLARKTRASVAETLAKLNGIPPSQNGVDTDPEDPEPGKPRSRHSGTIRLKH